MSWAENADSAHLMCRDTGIRHRWEPLTVERNGRGFVETLACGRCSAEKDRTLSSRGVIGKTKMRYPDGFLRVGEGRLTKSENANIRLISLKQRYEL